MSPPVSGHNWAVSLQPASGPSGTPDPVFDRFARLVHATLGVPVALVSLVSSEGQVFPGALGLPEPWQSHRGTPLSHSYCQHVVASDQPLVVSDARTADLLKDNLAIRDLDAIAYAGYPVREASGETVGSLCAIDNEPRTWTPAELAVLSDLADACSAELALRSQTRRADHARRAERAQTRRTTVLLAMSEKFAATETVDEVLEAIRELGGLLADVDRTSVALLRGRTVLEWAQYDEAPGTPDGLLAPRTLDELEWPIVWVVHNVRPLVFENPEQLVERFPAMRAIARGALAVVPLITRTAVLGAVAVRWAEPREIDDDVTELLLTLGRYAALALERASLLQSRQDVALTLERAMLGSVHSPCGVSVDVAYAPAADTEMVGGDWYDMVELDDGAWFVAVGDVTGHDLRAATAMGRLRTILLTLAWDTSTASYGEHGWMPASVVERFERAAYGIDARSTGTAVVGRFEPGTPGGPGEGAGARRFVWTSAGHPRPLVVRADGGVQWAEGRSGLPFGLGIERPRYDNELWLKPGDTLVLFTDGLVERRGTNLSESFDAMAAVAGSLHPLTASTLAEALTAGAALEDDVAVVTMRIDPA
jgi:GAF domain-containing protein